ncbi:MAG TPA: SDR family NAD(P)-dependent oxidoreductase, partial [bacterium]|nr:SDR family NAD(P)-dependent oxidoreductase [bacterium]
MSLIGMIQGRGPSGFGYDSTAAEVLAGLDLRGKTFLVTGATSGIGLETLRALCARGARVLALARTVEKAQAACALAQGTRAVGTAGSALPVACDLGDPASVRAAVAAVSRLGGPLDALIANAGIMALPRLERQHGYEAQFFTNHVGHFLLVTGLLGRLAPQGRVVMVSSEAHHRAPPGGIELDNLTGERGYQPWRAYAQSKLANLLFAKHLATRLPAGQTAHALHPGVIATNLGRHMHPALWITFQVLAAPFLKSIAQGAATQCYVATHAAPG